MPDIASALCRTCRGQRFCPNCLGWADEEVPCSVCRDNDGLCPDCDGTGERHG